MEVTFVVRIGLRRGWHYLQIPEQDVPTTSLTAPDPKNEQEVEGKCKGKGVSAMAPYLGTSVRTNKGPSGREGYLPRNNPTTEHNNDIRERKGNKGKGQGTGVSQEIEDPRGKGVSEVQADTKTGRKENPPPEIATTTEDFEKSLFADI